MIGHILILILLLIINGFFSGAEIAILSVNHTKVLQKSNEGDKRYTALLNIIENSSDFLSTIQIGVSFASILIGALSAIAFVPLFIELMTKLNLTLDYFYLLGISLIIVTLIISFLSLIFGELVPKKLAVKYAESMSLKIIRPVNSMRIILKPFLLLLNNSTNLILKILGIDPNATNDDATEEEIRKLIDSSGESGLIDNAEKEMINNIFEFDNKTADDIATHRKDLVALPIDCTKGEIIEITSKKHFSRIPIYEETIDNIVGILYIKDLIKYALEKNSNNELGINKQNEHFDFHEILRNPFFYPASKKTDALFKDMQINKVHIAIIVDEYGGTVGIVTMEDLIEEIMGSILDEYDEEEKPEIVELENGTFLVDGTTCIEDIFEMFSIKLPNDDFDTISGFLISELDRVPEIDEQPEIIFNNILFKINEVKDNRIVSVIISKIIAEANIGEIKLETRD